MSAVPSVMQFSSLEQRALELLANGHQAVTVAAHLGVTESRISQLVSEPAFAKELATRKFDRAIAASTRDNKWDELEDLYLDRLKQLAPMAYKFNDVLRAVTVINAAKRRGGSPVTEAQAHAEVIPLTLPTTIVQNFRQNIQVNVANQVIQAGTQSLQTIQAKALDELIGVVNEPKQVEVKNGQDPLVLPEPAAKAAIPEATTAGFVRIGSSASKEVAGSGSVG